jgi:hypothetical protein
MGSNSTLSAKEIKAFRDLTLKAFLLFGNEVGNKRAVILFWLGYGLHFGYSNIREVIVSECFLRQVPCVSYGKRLIFWVVS